MEKFSLSYCFPAPVGAGLRIASLFCFLIVSLFYCFIAPFHAPGGAWRSDAGLRIVSNEVLAQEPEAVIEAETPSNVAEVKKEAGSSSIVERVVEKKEDITEPTSEIKGKLERHLSEHPIGPLTITNFLQHSVRSAIKQGVAANTIVLVLMFPLVAAIIGISRHIVGVKGFGIFLPAVLSVVFVATGITVGILLFLTIIIVATGARMILRKLKLQYLPRMALLLWFVCLGVLGFLFLAPFLNLVDLVTISIFPILILILLAENFISIQIGMSMKQAVGVTLQTLVMALICSLVLGLEFLQKFVLLNPEIMVLSVAILDIFIGKYAGLRLLEYKKFRELLK